MNQNNIITFFPKAVYLEDNVCIDTLSEIESSIRNISDNTARNSVLNVDSSHRTIRTIHERPEFYSFTKEIKRRVKKFMICYGYDPEMTRDLEIRNMWFNISGKGDFLFPHTHPGSLISGAFYVKTTIENHILFYEHHKNSYIEPTKITPLSESVKNIACVPGRLLLFHSDMEHGTPIQREDGEKIVISFNTYLKER